MDGGAPRAERRRTLGPCRREERRIAVSDKGRGNRRAPRLGGRPGSLNWDSSNATMDGRHPTSRRKCWGDGSEPAAKDRGGHPGLATVRRRLLSTSRLPGSPGRSPRAPKRHRPRGPSRMRPVVRADAHRRTARLERRSCARSPRAAASRSTSRVRTPRKLELRSREDGSTGFPSGVRGAQSGLRVAVPNDGAAWLRRRAATKRGTWRRRGTSSAPVSVGAPQTNTPPEVHLRSYGVAAIDVLRRPCLNERARCGASAGRPSWAL